jgi:carbonic anhydrase
MRHQALSLTKLQHLFDQNVKWASKLKENDPEFFLRLSKQHNPEYLWIGCSDSRVPANQIVNLPPGEIFVHRNIGNVVVHTDLNCLSVIHFAVETLHVKHIVVCGHYGCAGVSAAMGNHTHGLADNWLRHIKDVSRLNPEKLSGLDEEQKFERLCELNVIEQVRNVSNTTTVQQAWQKGGELSVHGWIYNIADGLLMDLNTSVSSNDQTQSQFGLC